MRLMIAGLFLFIGALGVAAGASTPVFAEDILCDPSLSTTGGKWASVRWGTWADSSAEPPYHIACEGTTSGNGRAARVTTGDSANYYAVGLEWYKNTPYPNLRRAEISFMVPAGMAPNWNHLALFAAYRRPIDGEPVFNPDVRFGRIGADVFSDAVNGQRLVIQFTHYNDTGCDPDGSGPLPADILFGWQPISGGLQPNHWYRLNTQITRRADGGLNVIGTLQDVGQAGFPIIAQTSFSAPPACTPTWYDSPQNRWMVGFLGNAQGVDAYLDDFVGYPEQTPPAISSVSVSNITAASARVSWITHESATSQVEYGTTTGYGSLSPLDATRVLSHAVNLSSLNPNALYHYRVKSSDAVGNASVGTDQTFRTLADTIAPTVSITSPANGSTVRKTVTVAATASDNVAVTKVEFYLDGFLKATDTSSPYSWSWDTRLVGTGSHSLTAKAYDGAGNTRTSASIGVTVRR